RTLSRPARKYGAGVDGDSCSAAGYQAMTSISRGRSGSNASFRPESVTTHRVVPTGDEPVGGGNSKAPGPGGRNSAQANSNVASAAAFEGNTGAGSTVVCRAPRPCNCPPRAANSVFVVRAELAADLARAPPRRVHVGVRKAGADRPNELCERGRLTGV